MVTYASYLNKKSNLPKLSIGVASLDTIVGLMAGLITFPIVMTFGLSDAIKASTISTLFISIPTGLGSSGLAGRIVAIAFFGLVYIAAITSSLLSSGAAPNASASSVVSTSTAACSVEKSLSSASSVCS